jgi:hypothetical protein
MKGNFQKVSFPKPRRNQLPGKLSAFFFFSQENIKPLERVISFSQEVVLGGKPSGFEEENPGP